MTTEPDPLPDTPDSWYAAYTADPTPQRLGEVVGKLQPTINYALNSVQATNDPFMKARARTIAGKAIQTYTPTSGASLPTWVTQQLQQLHRVRRQSQSPVKLPERVMLDNMSLFRASQDFVDKFNREPDLEELSDAAKMSVKRIQTVRRTARMVPASGAMGDAVMRTPIMESDPLFDEAVGYIYKDADKLDRKIIEMKTGYGGKFEPMAPNMIGQQLGLSPAQLSRRSAKLALSIGKTHRDLQEVAG